MFNDEYIEYDDIKISKKNLNRALEIGLFSCDEWAEVITKPDYDKTDLDRILSGESYKILDVDNNELLSLTKSKFFKGLKLLKEHKQCMYDEIVKGYGTDLNGDMLIQFSLFEKICRGFIGD